MTRHAPDSGKRVLEAVLSAEAVERRGVFRHAHIAQWVADHRANRVDATDHVLSLLNLEIWCRLYLDGRTPESVTTELKAA